MNIEPRPEEQIANVRFKRNLLNYERGDEIFSNVVFGWMGKILYAETKWNNYMARNKNCQLNKRQLNHRRFVQS